MRSRTAFPFLLAPALLALQDQGAAHADPPPTASTVPAVQPATAVTGAGPAAGSTPPEAPSERPLGDLPFPTDPSKQPTPAEWASAPTVRLTRMGPAAAGCRAYRVREWIRFRCPHLTVSAISHLGGRTEGVAFWITPPKDSDLPRGGEVMFPIRRGDRRVFQILTFGAGYDGPFTLLPAIILQEQWLDGDPQPTLIAR
ncbi:hypothetical protein [Chondromyces crocatus]|uniref:Secreted protein n=1 Tax=Chondromyces crocatus TaxID=52 RepID=A0A0K1E8T7_CHOCO|nr:hypothetical protein [Chondromyces crocatus]AKT37280.1 uncharacterized protein CMC5_014110 [Chondromyces crocatus]